jgi:hypothetical protein
MPRQSQVIAIEKDEKKRAKEEQTTIYKVLQKHALFQGQTREFHKLDDAAPDRPSENQHVQYNAEDLLHRAVKGLSSYFDCVLTKDKGNQVLSADVEVNGHVILKDAPITFLLFLEKEIIDLITVIKALPVLDPAHTWTYDDTSKIYRGNKVVTQSTTKEQVPVVLYDATKEHPAQTQLVTKDVPVGDWHTTAISGGIKRETAEMYLNKATDLLAAVKQAREEANSGEVKNHSISQNIIDYLFG